MYRDPALNSADTLPHFLAGASIVGLGFVNVAKAISRVDADTQVAPAFSQSAKKPGIPGFSLLIGEEWRSPERIICRRG